MPQDLAALQRISPQTLLDEEAARLGIRPELARAIAQRESNFNQNARGPVTRTGERAIGILQLMPGTARDQGVDPTKLDENIRGGLQFFKQQLDRFGGDEAKALAAYNAGPALVAARGIPNYPETKNYVSSIQQAAPPPGPPIDLSRLQKVTAATPEAQDTPPAPPMDLSRLQKVTPAPTLDPAAAPDLAASHARPTPFDQGPRPMGIGETIAGGKTLGQKLVQGYDPRSPEGRRNIGGTLGALGAVAAIPVTGGLSALAVPAAGAFVGGGLAEGVNIALEPPRVPGPGEPPQWPTYRALQMAKAGGEQAAYDVVGGVGGQVVTGIGRRAYAPKVATNAAAALDAEISKAAAHVKAVRAHGAEARAAVGERSVTAVEDATLAAKGAKSRLEHVFGQQPRLVSSHQAGQLAKETLEGPAKVALDDLGQSVTEAATTGPTVNIAKLKNALATMGEARTPSTRNTGTEGIPGFERAADVLGQTFTDPGAIAKQAELRGLLDSLGAGRESGHPISSLLDEIQALPDEISFLDAHKFKRLLDETINWEHPAKNQIQGITKAGRGELRKAMKGHAEYDAATQAYDSIEKLYSKGIADDFKRQIVDNPDVLVSLIKSNEPTKLRMWKDLLLRQSAAGGDAALGQRAWDATRAAWTHDKLTRGGLQGLGKRLDNLDPDFIETFYKGDAQGPVLLQNLKDLRAAYDATLGAGEAGILATKRLGRQEAIDVRHQTAQTLTQSMEEAAAARQTKEAFKKSTVGRTREAILLAADALRAGQLGLGSTWGAISFLRLLQAPQSAELLRYAAHSAPMTQAIVGALTGPKPGMALATLMRFPAVAQLMGLPGDLRPQPSHEPTTVPQKGPPPSQPGRAGGPGPKQGASLTVGQPVTLTDGRKHRITQVYPDGSFDAEPLRG